MTTYTTLPSTTNKVTFPEVTLNRLTVKPSVFVRMLKSPTLSTRTIASRVGLSKSAVQRHRARIISA
jgi:hypothetical protein